MARLIICWKWKQRTRAKEKNRSANGRDWDKRNGSRGREPVCSAEQVKVMNGCADWAVFILLCRNVHCERNPLNESQIELIPANEKSSSSRELPAEIERYILTWLCAPDDFWRRLEQIAGGWLGDWPGRIEYRPTDNEAMQVLFFLFGFMWHVMCNSRRETVRLPPLAADTPQLTSAQTVFQLLVHTRVDAPLRLQTHYAPLGQRSWWRTGCGNDGRQTAKLPTIALYNLRFPSVSTPRFESRSMEYKTQDIMIWCWPVLPVPSRRGWNMDPHTFSRRSFVFKWASLFSSALPLDRLVQTIRGNRNQTAHTKLRV